MENSKFLAITISRQLGSGGAYIGQRIAKELNIFYADREIIRKAAEKLSILENNIESRDEKILSFWESFFVLNAFAPEAYMVPKIIPPTDRELFEAESDVIRHIVTEHSAIIIGRCGFYVLHDHPGHVSIFLHAGSSFRNERIQKLYNVSQSEAARMIEQSDKERAFYCKTFTGKEWGDSRNYDLSIDTAKIGVDRTADLILNYLKLK